MPWSPQNKYVWDSWFVWRGEELHAFYLQADKAACGYNPDARHNLASVGHAVLSRWGWQACPDSFAASVNGNWDNFGIWTGSIVINEDGPPAAGAPYHLFYTSRTRNDAPLWTPSEWQRPQKIGLAVSNDLSNWQRVGKHEIIPNFGKPLGLDGVSWRDPYVVRGADGAWYAFICARLNPQDKNNSYYGLDAGGVIAWLKSDRLDHWNVEETQRLVASDEFYQLEVPQVFWREFPNGKRFYLLFCAQEKDCSRARRHSKLPSVTGTYYLQSELLPQDFVGVPELKGRAQLLAAGLYGGKLLKPETDETPVLLGFPWADAAGHFIGGISDPLRVRFDADGNIHLIE